MVLKQIQPIPDYVDASWCRALRDSLGDPPCKDGLQRALKFIGDRESVRLDDLLSAMTPDDAEWARLACGLDGYGCGYGHGYGDGDGHGYGVCVGYGEGDGYGHGYGDGDGYGDGHGYGRVEP